MGQKFKKRKSQSVFGATLQAVNMHYQQSPHEVPYLVQEMILFIKRYGRLFRSCSSETAHNA